MTPDTDTGAVAAHDRLRRDAQARLDADGQLPGPMIHVGMATCGIAAGAHDTLAAFEEELAKRQIPARLHRVGCMGHCYAEPLVVIDYPDSGFPPLLYPEVDAGRARMLTRLFLEGGDPRFEFVLGAMTDNELLPPVTTFSRFSGESRVITAKCGEIDPDSIDEYLAGGGYAALAAALEMSPAGVIEKVRQSGLRGRGGAGFPTWEKWELTAGADNPDKVVVCNADEGDPGAYMDRTLLESNPHQLLEGLLICALAVGAQKAIVYVRAEYPLAVAAMNHAVEQAVALGLAGPHILGSRVSVEIRVFQGSGAFICGEETALIRSIEGYRGMPRHRPPYPAVSGLNGRPTVINNVKTLSAVPVIIADSAPFTACGTTDSPGTAIFSVVGEVVHPGLVEVPMGTRLRSLIFDICGGIANKKAFKAVQIGGPSGGCLGESHLDLPIDFDALQQAGAMMGSGGLVVMDEDSCVVDVARYFLDFTQKESCGKCTFCRIGTMHLLTILERITKGAGRTDDIDTLLGLSRDIRLGSLCGLGRTAPNPVLTAIAHFRDEFDAHVLEKRCPGMTCRALIAFYIDLDKCARGCDACVTCCPVDAVFTTSTRKKGIDQSLCVKCGECMVACPPEYDAVRKVSPADRAPIVERPPEPIKDA